MVRCWSIETFLLRKAKKISYLSWMCGCVCEYKIYSKNWFPRLLTPDFWQVSIPQTVVLIGDPKRKKSQRIKALGFHKKNLVFWSHSHMQSSHMQRKSDLVSRCQFPFWVAWQHMGFLSLAKTRFWTRRQMSEMDNRCFFLTKTFFSLAPDVFAVTNTSRDLFLYRPKPKSRRLDFISIVPKIRKCKRYF